MSESTENLELIIANALNLYCFQNIWNEPTSEFRNNIIPDMLSENSGSGNIYLNSYPVPLPTTTEPYYVYMLSATTMYGVNNKLLDSKWISTEDLCNKHDILIHTYHLSGRMFHKGYTYIYPLPDRSGYLLAISKAMSSRIATHEEMVDIRVTVYYDSDITNKLTIKSYFTPRLDEDYTARQEIIDYLQTCTDGNDHLTVFVDGYETYLKGISTITTNSYIDIIHDENAVFAFDVDITLDKYNIGFYSEKDKLYKHLVHIPKELNPDNNVYTHNTMDIFVRSKLKDGSKGKGLYLHRCADRSVSQVTHNDIAIPIFMLDAYRDHLENQDITLHVIVRKHDKDNVLVRDKSYIDLLYTLDDDTIVNHLLGKISSKLDFWKASNLEQSVYINMMFDVPNIITASNMFTYVEGLGYYHTLSLLCERVRHTVLTDWFKGALSFSKPYLYQNTTIYPVVYLNGYKVNHEHILKSNDDPQSVTVGFDDSVVYRVGDIMSVEMYLDGHNTIYSINIDSDNNTIEIPYTDFILLEEINNSYIIKGFNRSSTYSYEEFTNYIGNIVISEGSYPGFTKLLFGPSLYGKTFIIQNKTCVYHWSKNIDDLLQSGNIIVGDIHNNTVGTTHEVPIWFTPHTLVYLNGKHLIEGLDYTIQESRDYDRRLSLKQIVVQNFQYMKTEGNILEWISTAAEVENSIHNFIVNNKAWDNSNLALLFDNMTMMHIDGRLEPNVINKGNYIQIPEGKYREGAPFETLTAVPNIIKNFLNKYHPNDDTERIEVLNEYFYGHKPPYPDKIILTDQHKCYSIYVAAIISDVVNDVFTVSFDPDTERMLTQLTQYQYIANADLVQQDIYNLEYVDVFPHYRNFEIEDPEKYRAIQALLALLMPEDKYTSGTIYY